MIDRISTQNININRAENKNKKQSFQGAGASFLAGLRGLNNSPAVGACVVDLGSMVIPRTAIEAKNRGPQAGIEAAFREGTSCLIHACVGLIGLGAATLISGKFNQANGVKAQNIFANGASIRNMSEMWKRTENQSEFFDNFVQNLRGLNGKKWRAISSKSTSSISENLTKLAEKSKLLSDGVDIDKKVLKKEIEELKKLVIAQITKDTGAQATFRLNAVKDEAGNIIQKSVSSSLSELVDNAVILSNSFKGKPKEHISKFAKELIKNKNSATALGMGICALMCMSVQPVNRYLTKKRTGQDGFVGVENKGADKSKGFNALKTVAGIAFPTASIFSIGKLSDLMSNIQFNSKVPTLNQFKFLYGLTIGSRFMAARDPNELREAVIKDTLGYTNWLVLGGMVSKLVARGIGGKDLINNPVVDNGKKDIAYGLKWLTKASVKSYDEVLLPKAKELVKDGKTLNFKALYKQADKLTKSKVKKIALSQVAGYLYSGIVLGVGIAKLNIFITKKLNAKKDAQEEMNVNMDKNKTVTAISLPSSSDVFKDFN